MEYVNIEYVEGYITQLSCFAIDFLNDTYPCTTQAPVVWGTYKTKYLALSIENQQTLQNADYTGKNYNNCTDIEKCCWRYDLAVKNLGLENFMNRSIQKSNIMNPFNDASRYIALAIMGVITMLNAISFVLIKRRKNV